MFSNTHEEGPRSGTPTSPGPHRRPFWQRRRDPGLSQVHLPKGKRFMVVCSRTMDTRRLNPYFFAGQIQIPILNKYLGFGFKEIMVDYWKT